MKKVVKNLHIHFLIINQKVILRVTYRYINNYWINELYFRSYSYEIHCVKGVHIRSFSGPYFPAFELNTKRHGVILSPKNFENIIFEKWRFSSYNIVKNFTKRIKPAYEVLAQFVNKWYACGAKYETFNKCLQAVCR